MEAMGREHCLLERTFRGSVFKSRLPGSAGEPWWEGEVGHSCLAPTFEGQRGCVAGRAAVELS